MKTVWLLGALVLCVVTSGCGGPDSATFVDYDFSFGFLERVAVIPFEDLSGDQNAGAKATRYFTSSLLAAEAFDVVEPGEVSFELQKLSVLRTAELTTDRIVQLGKALGVQGMFLGTVSESSAQRTGGSNVRVVTIVVRLVETETGATIWSTTKTNDSATFWSGLLGTKQKSMSEVTRNCVNDCLSTLFH